MVILTNGSVVNPLKVYDGYNARSEIENSLIQIQATCIDKQTIRYYY
jgi:hypothetical protein